MLECKSCRFQGKEELFELWGVEGVELNCPKCNAVELILIEERIDPLIKWFMPAGIGTAIEKVN